jgi:RNA-directed DNA polymerase
MRVAQYRILKEILEKIEVPDYVCAFEKDRNIPDMAALHVNKKIIVSVDLKDFFTSIKQFHVNQIFEHLGFESAPARTLSELCTYGSFVPQGALTSPKLSNIVTSLTFGPIIKAFCEEHGYILTIYADDITVSSTEKMDGLEGRLKAGEVVNFIRKTVGSYGFQLNPKKIKIMKNHMRQYVCGAVVNSKVNMQFSERNRLRAIVHNCLMNGIVKEAEKFGVPPDKFSAKIMGRLNWFSQLNPVAGEKAKTKFKEVCADQIMCPTAETESVKDAGSLDGLPITELLLPETETNVPW